MTLLARRRDELARRAAPEEEVEESRAPVVRPRPQARGFFLVQEALGNRAAGSLLGAGRMQPEATARLLVDGGASPGPGQMTRDAFLSSMRDAAREAAEAGLAGTGHTARGCPWIEHYFRFYQRLPAERIEADLARYVPATARAASAEELLDLAARHVKASVEHWSRTGELAGVPQGLPGMTLMAAVGGSLAGVGRRLRDERRAAAPAAGATDLARIEEELGPGRALDASARSRMERAFGTGLGEVRLHTDPEAARLARGLGARAFAVGRHVAFAAGEYRPGTLVGDALLAHELAHTLQQRGAHTPAPATAAPRISASVHRAEGDANAAAAGVLGRLWAGPLGLAHRFARQPRPRLRLGLTLAACRETFSDQELREYLQHLKTTGLWGGLEGDNRARAVVRENIARPGTFDLEDIHVQRMILEMLEGSTGAEDQTAILELLQRSNAARLRFLFTAGGLTPRQLLDKFDDERATALRAFFEQRFEGGLRALEAGTVRPIEDVDLPAVRPSLLERPEDTTGFFTEAAAHIAAETARARAMLTAGNRGAHEVLNQQRVARWLSNLRSAYQTATARLGAGAAAQGPLRRAYLDALLGVREAASTALEAAEGLDPAIVTRERAAYAENAAAWIEASPMTSAGLAGTREFQQSDVESARRYEAELERYLDDLLQRLPTLGLTQAQKDAIHDRILVALRRAFVTVAAGPAGRIDVRAITNPAIADKYLRVTAFLAAGMSARPQMSLITSSLAEYELPDPVHEVSPPVPAGSRIRAEGIDVSRVPADEVLSVRYAIYMSGNPFSAPSTNQQRNAYWPVTIPVRRGPGQPVERVRYEFVFDDQSNLRVERLGPAEPRATASEFTRLPVADKKARLVQDFGLSGVDDRPAAPPQAPTLAQPAAAGQPATRARPALPARDAAAWTGAELDQLKAALDLLPQADRSALHGFALVREHQEAPDRATAYPMAGLTSLAGLTHISPDVIFDEPVPPAHPAPHIHFYDSMFSGNPRSATGPPGATGPGGDFSIVHEVGHALIDRAIIGANAAMDAANQRAALASPRLQSVTLTGQAQIDAFRVWNRDQSAANHAIVAFADSAAATPPATPEAQALLLQTAQATVQTRNQARLRLLGTTPRLPGAVITAINELDGANDDRLAAGQQQVAAHRQIPIFNALAQRLGFHKFTDYARRGGPDEWFSETYALYLTDPQRLLQMNRGVYLWFRAGMPMDPNWNPPAQGGI